MRRPFLITLIFLALATFPTGCRLLMDIPDAPEGSCGDGLREGLEPCDGFDLGDKTCADLGFTAGALNCKSDCTFDTSLCFLQSDCGPANCAGCCAPGGVCQGGTDDVLCGTGGEPCLDCTLMGDMVCQTQTCVPNLCQDSDGDGRGADCALGEDACESDGANWTAEGCLNCRDADGDGFRGNGCDTLEDSCDLDAFNWTAAGCANCRDADGDGWRGDGCDIPEDCDDAAPGVTGPCQANGCPQGWIVIPAGPFQRGCNPGELDGTCESDEQPRHVATLSAFCVQPTEVSVGAFRACRDAGVCVGGLVRTTDDNSICNYSDDTAGREHHPLNCITWEAARQYCQSWMGGEFPTEAQWEKAARGADPDTRKFPWGNGPEPSCLHSNYAYCHSSNAPVTWPVGYLSNGAGDSPYGLKDMAGNLWEMTLDSYVETAYADCAGGCSDPVQSTGGVFKVIRGGGYHHPIPAYHRVTERSAEDPAATSLNLGFRCGRSTW